MRILILAGAAAVAALTGPLASAAPKPAHANYLHALHDLEAAHTAVASRGGTPAMEAHEKAAGEHIHSAADLIRKVAPEVGKNIAILPPTDTNPAAKIGKLHDAIVYLDRARSNLWSPETDQAVIATRRQAIDEIGAAEAETKQAIAAFAAPGSHAGAASTSNSTSRPPPRMIEKPRH